MFYYFILATIALAILIITTIVVVETAKCIKSDNKEDIKPIEYNAPDNLSSAEVGYIYRGSNSILDTISLLPFLASKGYIEISNMKFGQKKSETNDDKIYILKKYDGKNISEKMMMEYLDRICIPTDKKGALKEISINEVKENFIGMDSVIGWRMSRELNPKLFNLKFKNYAWVVNLFFVEAVLSVFMIVIDCIGFDDLFSILWISSIIVGLVSVTGLAAFLVVKLIFNDTGTLASFNNKTINKPKTRILAIFYGIIFGAMFGAVPIFLAFNATNTLHSWYDTGLYILGFCCSVVIINCIERIRRTKSEYGKEVYGKICGFREYLEKVEKDKIKTLVREDPKLCYKMIAFAYALGVSRDWVDEFEVGIKQG